MLYRISKWKTNSSDLQSSNKRLNSLSTFRNLTIRPVAVVKPVPIVDQREVAFRHFTEIPSIDRKKKSTWGYRPKTQKNNAFLEFLGVPVNKSTVVVEPTCKSTGVAASVKHRSPSKLSVGSNTSVSSVCQLIKEMENRDQEPTAKTPSNIYRPVTTTIDIDYDPIVIDVDKRRPNLKRKALVKKVNPIDLLVAMFNDLTLDDKRKIKESEMEHFETFHAHRLLARPYAKRMKPLNN